MNARRNFISNLMASILTTVDEIRGIPQLKLSELDTLPDERLAKIIPYLDFAEILFKEKEGDIFRKDPKSGTSRRIDTLNHVEQSIVRRFSGQETIADIAVWAAKLHNLSEDDGFRITRGLFLRLSKQRVCYPTNIA